MKRSRADGTNLRSLGLSPRQLGIAPRQVGVNPRDLETTLDHFGLTQRELQNYVRNREPTEGSFRY